jgi:flagellar basal-body rod protein FlgC
MDIIASNLANMETTRTDEGGPYRRKMVVMKSKPMASDFKNIFNSKIEGVQIEDIIEDKSSFKKVYNPSHPDADENGYLLKPNVDLVVETTNMLMAKRAFEANIAVIKATRQMVLKALELGR